MQYINKNIGHMQEEWLVFVPYIFCSIPSCLPQPFPQFPQE